MPNVRVGSMQTTPSRNNPAQIAGTTSPPMRYSQASTHSSQKRCSGQAMATMVTANAMSAT